MGARQAVFYECEKGGIMKVRTFRLTLSLAVLLSWQIPSRAQWAQTNGPYGGFINCLAVVDTNLFAGTYGGGVFRSADNGATWTAAGTGLTNPCVLSLCTNGPNLFAGTDGAGAFRSTDNGSSWAEINAGLTNASVRALAVSGTNLFAGTNGGGVFLSTDSGANWAQVNAGLTNDHVGALAVSGGNLFAGTWEGVFLSPDNGTSWAPINTGLTNTDVRAFAACDTNLFAGTNGGGVFLSTDNGTSWTADNKGLADLYVRAFMACGAHLFVSITNTWQAHFASNGIYLLTDHGLRWTSVQKGMKNTVALSLAVNGSNLFAGTDVDGVWRRPLSEMVTSVEEPSADRRLPDHFSMDQNYPNPFNPATAIVFHLPASSFVTLKMFNPAGKEVATLVDRRMPAGNHRTEWNASGMPSGIYFYRIQAGAYSETKKIVVIR
jgi:ligand-binding sensor domain-containing protein